ncbi:hypothetical protein E5093_09785 [Acinetobacter indicus]|nr:hypothetical protein E5093_09785 [Acinetobacter indicus]
MAVVSIKFLPPFPVKEVFFYLEKSMLQFLQRLFCFHAYEFDYNTKRGYTYECRKCGKDY